MNMYFNYCKCKLISFYYVLILYNIANNDMWIGCILIFQKKIVYLFVSITFFFLTFYYIIIKLILIIIIIFIFYHSVIININNSNKNIILIIIWVCNFR